MKLIRFLLIAGLLGGGGSMACSCIGDLDVPSEFEHAHVVFEGEVVRGERFAYYTSSGGEEYFNMRYTFQVDSWYKGRKRGTKMVEVVTGLGNGDCGYRFQLGQRYVVYATQQKQFFASGEKVSRFWYTDICTRTTSLVDEERQAIAKHRSRRWSRGRLAE